MGIPTKSTTPVASEGISSKNKAVQGAKSNLIKSKALTSTNGLTSSKDKALEVGRGTPTKGKTHTTQVASSKDKAPKGGKGASPLTNKALEINYKITHLREKALEASYQTNTNVINTLNGNITTMDKAFEKDVGKKKNQSR
jgi:hypothetical protein